MSFDKNTWATPQYLFNWLDEIYNFDIDLCANEENHKVGFYFDETQDSLNMSWHKLASSGFCNCPYSDIKPCVKKAIIEATNGFTTVMLIPTPNAESYYQDVFKHATSITFITGRIAFYNPVEKREVGGNTRGSCVIEFSKKHRESPLQVFHVMRDELK